MRPNPYIKYMYISTACIALFLFCISAFLFGFIVYRYNIEPHLMTKDIIVSPETIKIAKNIENTCLEELEKMPEEGNLLAKLDECIIKRIENFSLKNIRKDGIIIEQILYLHNTPEETMEKGGDCDNIAQLFCSLYYSAPTVTIKNKKCFIIQESIGNYGHVCAMFKYINDEYKLFNCYDPDYILKIVKAKPKVRVKE